MALIKRIVNRDVEHRNIASIEPEKPIILDSKCKDIFGIDVGFGYVKLTSDITEAIIPSLIVEISDLKELQFKENLDFAESLTIEMDGKIYLVGEIAARFNRQSERTTFRERDNDNYFAILYRAAIATAYNEYGNVELDVVTGLPNSDLNQTEDLRNIIEKTKEVIYYHDGKRYQINLDYNDISVIAQPEGCYYSVAYDETAKKIEQRNDKDIPINTFGVLDFGHGTLNISIFANGDTLGMGTTSTSLDGANSIYKMLGLKIREGFTNFEPTHIDLEKAMIHNQIKIRGQIYDVKHLVDEVKDRFAEETFRKVYEKWGNDIDSLDAIFVIGGGANILLERIANLFYDKLKYTNVYAVGELEDIQLINVRGYRIFGLLKHKE